MAGELTQNGGSNDPKSKNTGEKLCRTVALVGLMGAGKSTVGRLLSQAVGVRFRDSDQEIERAAAMSVTELFERFGEPYFREGERRVIARLLRESPQILATGGGAYMDSATREDMRQRACVVWLRADLDTLAERCGRRNERPLLANSSDPRGVLEELMEERYPIYGKADVIVSIASTASPVGHCGSRAGFQLMGASPSIGRRDPVVAAAIEETNASHYADHA